MQRISADASASHFLAQGTPRTSLSRLRGADSDYAVLHRIRRSYPGLESTFQRADALKSQLFHLQRHTGAGRFARSSTNNHELALEWQLLRACFDIFRQYVDRAGNTSGIVQYVQGMT